jgi:hypothetical protein
MVYQRSDGNEKDGVVWLWLTSAKYSVIYRSDEPIISCSIESIAHLGAMIPGSLSQLQVNGEEKLSPFGRRI